MRAQPKTEHRIAYYTSVAKMANLSCPLGRAVKAESEIQNSGRLWGRWGQYLHEEEAVLEFMKRVRPETAKRWEAHYRAGGSIRVLGRSRAGQNAWRRAEKVVWGKR